MTEITKETDLKAVGDNDIRLKINELLQYFLKEYSAFCADGTIQSLGAIIVLEDKTDWNKLLKYGITAVNRDVFEWIDSFTAEYKIGCIVIDNDKSLNIIGKNEFFDKYTEENKV